MNRGKITKSRINVALFLRRSVFCHSTKNKMATRILTVYWPRAVKHFLMAMNPNFSRGK